MALALDDLHWADTATVELLHYLARGVGGRRVLLVGAYRSDEAEVEPTLQALVGDLRRAGLGEELPLAGLAAGAVQSLARAVLGDDSPPALAGLLAARAAGSPLVVTALLGELLASGGLFRSGGAWALGPGALDAVPAVVRDLVLGRLQRLTAQQRMLLELVAVAGDAATPPVLADVLGADEERLLARLRRLRDLGLVAEVTEGWGARGAGAAEGGSSLVHRELIYRAAHPAYAEVAYAELPEATRRRLHAAVAVALERRWPHDVELLAPSTRARAGRPTRGARSTCSWPRVSARLPCMPVRRPRAPWKRRCRTPRRWVGTTGPPRSWSAWARRGRPPGTPRPPPRPGTRPSTPTGGRGIPRGWHAPAASSPSSCWDRGRFERAQEVLAEGFAASARGVPHTDLIGLHEVRVRLLSRLGDIPAVGVEADELLALGKRHGSLYAVAVSDLFRTVAHLQEGAYIEARQACLRAVAAAERLGDVLLAEKAHRPLVLLELALGGHEQARPLALRGLGLARSAGIPTLEVMPRFLLVFTGFLAGEWDGAWRETTELLALAHRVGSARGVALGLLGRALVLTHRGQLAAATACLAEARSAFGGGSAADRHLFSGDQRVHRVVDSVDALIALQRDDPSGALAAAEGLAATSRLTLAPFSLAALGEAQVAAGDLDAALGTAARLAALGPAAPWPAALAARLEGLAHHARGGRVAALVPLRRAAAGFDGLAMPFEAARCRLEWALAAAPQRPDDATAAAQESLTVFAGLGAHRFADRARRLLRDLGARPAPARRGTGPATGLSDRETEVVRLVAEGLSNAEIARRLVISPRTVTTHLQHVYARLGLPSRTALARYAVEHDLLGGAKDT